MEPCTKCNDYFSQVKIFKNIVKKITLIFLCYLLVTTLTACGEKRTEREKFLSFLGQEKNSVISKSEIDMCIISLDKEYSSNPKVVIQISPNENGYEKTYDWLCLPAAEQKEDMKDFGDKVIAYAKEENWDNNYYLYITFICSDICIVYDYEMSELWVPNNIDTYKEMYEKFDTLAITSLTQTEEGKNFLVDNNLATIKHNEVELSHSNKCYTVYISNGEFASYGKDGSHIEH